MKGHALYKCFVWARLKVPADIKSKKHFLKANIKTLPEICLPASIEETQSEENEKKRKKNIITTTIFHK
ncbi:hypothetical protein T4B_11008 [Trichinella pseudospiralis]|uniref:Uncharacterized protein n=2 Tax=Trichinella pseudospiralis TaxID=6337 RepID=A0A0V1IIB1_TRIPS|nr:hypothetical protein T4D_16804 [Trichinella pseudospiralis]KRZ22308.1 hypothetical protein T4B_11008 [Trichinella pseudospiralis]